MLLAGSQKTLASSLSTHNFCILKANLQKSEVNSTQLDLVQTLPEPAAILNWKL
jgi:hypothetical protein